MSPNSDSACRQAGSDWACAGAIAATPAIPPRAGAIAAKAPLCRRFRRVIAKGENPVAVGLAEFGTQYKATARQIMLLFPHDTSPDAAKGPDNKTASPAPHAKTARHCLAAYREFVRGRDYFAAVGSGTGLSASLCR